VHGLRAFITPCGPFDEPVSHFRTALLTVTMAMAVLVCVFLVTMPPETDKIMLDLPIAGPSHLPPTVPRPLHQLVIDKNGRWAIDGTAVRNAAELRRMVDAMQMQNPIPDLQVEPDPAVRYEEFVKVLYVIKRAHVYRVCFDWDPPQQRTDLLAAARERCPPPLVPIL
jgi:biopolymer transport protein ExbD